MEQKKKRVYRKRIPYGMMNFEDISSIFLKISRRK